MQLHNILLDKKYDSTFVREAMEKLYTNEIWKLKERSIYGSKKSNNIKLPITPDKLATIKILFGGRLSRVTSTQDMEKRSSRSYFNRLVSDAIGNISKKITVCDIDVMEEDDEAENEKHAE